MGQIHNLVHNICAGCSTGSPVSSAVSNLVFFFFSALGLPCFMWAFSIGCSKQELLFVVVHGILTAVASPVVEHRF